MERLKVDCFLRWLSAVREVLDSAPAPGWGGKGKLIWVKRCCLHS